MDKRSTSGAGDKGGVASPAPSWNRILVIEERSRRTEAAKLRKGHAIQRTGAYGARLRAGFNILRRSVDE